MGTLLVAVLSFILACRIFIRLVQDPFMLETWRGICMQVASLCLVCGCFFWILVALVGLSVVDM